MPVELSFIIVNYNVTGYLRKCLHSIQKFAAGTAYEVVVVDNASPDSSWKDLIQEFPEVIFIQNDKNEGFAKANNKAVRIAKGEYLFFLNPDTELTDFYLNEIMDFADKQPKFGALGLRMYNSKGIFLPESKRSVPNVISSFEKLFTNFRQNRRKSYYRCDISEYSIAEVEILTGANLLIQKAIYDKVGGFDERYFMYGEDIDLCFSILQLGYRNFYYGKYAVLHHKGKSTTRDSAYRRRFYGAMQIFIDKYYKEYKPIQHKILTVGLLLKENLDRIRK